MGAFDRELGGSHRTAAAGGDLVGRGQRQRELVGLDRSQQRVDDHDVDGVGAHRPAAGCGDVVGAGVAALIPRVGVLVADLHAAAARAAEHDALTQRGAFPRRAGPGVGAVGGQFCLVGQVLREADVAAMMVGDEHFPLVAGQLGGRGVHRAVRVHDLAGAAPSEHVCPGIDRIAQDPGRAGMGESAPAQLPGPRPAVGAARESASGERAGHAVGGAGLGERGEHIADRGGDLGVGVDDDLAVVVVDEPDRQRHPQLAAGRGGPFGLLQPAGQPVQLGL